MYLNFRMQSTEIMDSPAATNVLAVTVAFKAVTTEWKLIEIYMEYSLIFMPLCQKSKKGGTLVLVPQFLHIIYQKYG